MDNNKGVGEREEKGLAFFSPSLQGLLFAVTISVS